MIEIESKITGKQFSLHQLEQVLKPKGYVIGGSWDYDQGAFDRKFANDEGYQFLRLPFVAKTGKLDVTGTTVEMGTPYILHHVYKGGIDETSRGSGATAVFNQFQSPQDKDGTVSQQYIDLGKELLHEVEALLSLK